MATSKNIDSLFSIWNDNTKDQDAAIKTEFETCLGNM